MLSARTFPIAFSALRKGARISLAATATSFQEGDCVEINAEGSKLKGTVQEVRGGGWYSIQLFRNQGSSHDASPQIRKFRSTQLELSTQLMPSGKSSPTLLSEERTQTGSDDVLPPPPPPTIYDLDQAVMLADPVLHPQDHLYLKQVSHHLSFSKWVVFTDLHCEPSTLDTCLEIMEYVHRSAVELNAGIIFLGDWWHHRGTIRVDTLNSVLTAFESWTQPMVMIPGNHDQVTLGGHNHGLTPLQNAYRCQDSQIPGPLIFSHPTIFGQALFVPHLRDNAVMESVLLSSASQHATAIFCHADVKGAKMNDLIVSQHGVLPQFFPPRIPIYSGHFHKPHVVLSTKSQDAIGIEYVGSPYETTLSEAHQDKHLIVLDSANGWKTIERIPLNLGRKHYKANSVTELLTKQAHVQPGDRVVITLSTEELQDLHQCNQETGQRKASEFHETVNRLRKGGAAVEIREIKVIPSRPIGPGAFDADTRQLEELTPAVTLTSFFEEEVNRASMTREHAQELLAAGLELLKEMQCSEELPSANVFSDITLSSVSLEGFGPFKNGVTYPLQDRGLVLLRGTNKDGGSDSNGTGKSSLAMAALWGLTGSIDPRLVSDAKVADVVTDGCKMTKVTVHGMLNGEDFRIIRTKTASKTGLVFFLGDKDLTTQSSQETQKLVEEVLGINLKVLSRIVFHGQHAVNGLLEASDIKFKEELASFVPLELWQDASSLARSKNRNATNIVAELSGMTKLREKDLLSLEGRRDAALAHKEIRQLALEERRRLAQDQINRLAVSSTPCDIASIEMELSSLSTVVASRQREIKELKQDREEEVQSITAAFDMQSRLTSHASTTLQNAQRELDLASLRFEMAKSSLKGFEEKWQVNMSSGSTPILRVEKCPTCSQLISQDGDGHSHHEMKKAFQDEAELVLNEYKSAMDTLDKVIKTCYEATTLWKECDRGLDKARSDMIKIKEDYNAKVANTEALLENARESHASYSAQIRDVVSSMKSNSELQAINAALEAERWLFQSAEVRFSQLQHEFSQVEENLKEITVKAEMQQAVASTQLSLSNALGAKGVQNFVLQNAIEALQTLSQAYLDELSDGSLRLSLRLDAGDKIERRAFVRLPDGDFGERPLASISGGQWRRCSLALSLGLVDLMSRRGRLRSSVLVLDEPLTHLDRSGRSRVGSLLRKLMVRGDQFGGIGDSGICAGTIILILQDLAAEELEEAFDHIDEVVKSDGFSTVIVDEKGLLENK